MNRRRFIGGAIALAVAAHAGLHKPGLDRLVAESAEAEARQTFSLSDAEQLRADQWMRDLQALVDVISPAIDAIVTVGELEVPEDIEAICWEDLRALCGESWDRVNAEPPEHPQCRSWFVTHDA